MIEYPGNYSRFRVLKEARLAELTKNYELQQKEVQRLKVMIRRFRQWAHEGDNESFFKKAKELERRLAKLTLVKPPPPRKIGCKACLMVENLAKKFSSFKTCTSSTLIKYYSKTAVLQSIVEII